MLHMKSASILSGRGCGRHVMKWGIPRQKKGEAQKATFLEFTPQCLGLLSCEGTGKEMSTASMTTNPAGSIFCWTLSHPKSAPCPSCTPIHVNYARLVLLAKFQRSQLVLGGFQVSRLLQPAPGLRPSKTNSDELNLQQHNNSG